MPNITQGSTPRRTNLEFMKSLSHDALCWWWSLSETKQLDIELSCLEEGIDISDIIYLLSGQVFDDLQRQGGSAQGYRGSAGGQIIPCARQGAQTAPKVAELHRYNEHREEARAALDGLLGDLM